MTPYLLVLWDHRKTIKVIKVLLVEFAPYTGIAKAMEMTRNNRCLLVGHGNRH